MPRYNCAVTANTRTRRGTQMGELVEIIANTPKVLFDIGHQKSSRNLHGIIFLPFRHRLKPLSRKQNHLLKLSPDYL